MTTQIFGLIMASLCIVAATTILTSAILNKQNNAFKADQAEKDRKQSARNNTFNCEAIALYEDEKAKRESAETRIMILERQLKDARELLGKVKVADV